MSLRRRLALFTTLLAGIPACASTSDDADLDTDLDATELVDQPSPEHRASEDSFTAFESGQVRPLALSADGRYLYAVNTPDNRLEVFRNQRGELTPVGSVVVGLEPVAVAVQGREVWVVNHLSDSVSIVDVTFPSAPRVTRTLLVGDEPRDIVFAGPRRDRAFVTTAHRGQNTGRDPQLTTPGIGRADVWVYDANRLGDAVAGTPLTVINLFTDTPRALAVTADGRTVYAAGFHTGNQTTAVAERIITNSGGAPAPLVAADGTAAPQQSLIVKYRFGAPDGQKHWLDEDNRIWDDQVRFSLPDRDVFTIDATLPTPAAVAGGAVAGVGTVLFNMAVNPVSGKVYVTNLEARNEVRFEGHAAGDRTSVRGHVAESRITVLDGGRATPRHLNKHLDYSRDGTPDEAALSLAFPTGLEVSRDGARLYVAALGSSKLGIYDTRALEDDSFVPSAADQVELSGGGPTGVALDPTTGLVFVMTRFDNGISVVDGRARRELRHVTLYNPEPESLTRGRRFLYDAELSSSHGDSACASCHMFGDLDNLAWDLGDPDAEAIHVPGPFTTELFPFFPAQSFHPMKGPMATQSLRGMANQGPMHWRGDRTGGNAVAASSQPETGTFNERAAFGEFAAAFEGLLGRSEKLGDAEMKEFTDFILQLTYPPNPIRNLDNSLTAEQAAGREFYFNHDENGVARPSDAFHNCNGCHVLDPGGNAEHGVGRPGFFGTDGKYSFDAEAQFLKVPHLRNMYTKVGMFGMANTADMPIDTVPSTLAYLPPPLNDVSFQGDQIRGFGFTHDGTVDTLFRFFGANVFIEDNSNPRFPNIFGIPQNETGMVIRRNLEAFMLAFDSNLAPIVGQQVTLTAANADAARARIALLQQRAAAGECDLVVRGRFLQRERGFLYQPLTRTYLVDQAGGRPLGELALRVLSLFTELTFTAVPPGSGERIALDRDSDGVLDGDR
jgi:DNA-binding beta-propeller fold protein YncE